MVFTRVCASARLRARPPFSVGSACGTCHLISVQGKTIQKKYYSPPPWHGFLSTDTPHYGSFCFASTSIFIVFVCFLCINGVSDVHHFIQCADRSVLGGRICCGLSVLWLECPTSFLKRDAHCSVFVPVLILIAHVFAQRRSAACSGTGFSPQNASRHRQPYGNINPQ